MKSLGINFDYSILEDHKKVEDNARIIELLYIKYTITKTGDGKIISKLKEMRDNEEKLFGKLLKQI